MAKTPLKKFDGKDVIAAAVAITNAGDGLSAAMAVDPSELHHGETGYIVLEYEVAKVRFDPVKDAANKLIRVHILKAGAATFIDDELVAEAIERQKVRIEEAAGVHRLPMDDEAGEEG